MKIIFFMASFRNFLGAARSTAILASHLPPEIERLAVFPAEGRSVEGFRDYGVTSVIVPAPEELNLNDKRLLKRSKLGQALVFLRDLIPYTFRLVLFLKREKPSILHCQASRAVLLAGGAAMLCRIPVIWHVRGENILTGHGLLNRITHRLSTVVVVVADALKEGIDSSLPCRTIYNGIDLEAAKPSTEIEAEIRRLLSDRGFDEKRTVRLVTTSALLPHKGLHHIIGALQELFARQPQAARELAWLILGEANTEEKQQYAAALRERAEQAGVADNLLWVGWQDNGQAWIASSDILALPTVQQETFVYPNGASMQATCTEGFPRSVLEAMAAGKAVIASDVAGLKEMIPDRSFGHLAPPSDPSAIASALEELWTDPERRARIGEAARNKAMEFSIENSVRETVKLYHELLSPEFKSR